MTSYRFRIIVLLVLVSIAVGCGGRVNLASLDARELFDLGMKKYQKKKFLSSVEVFQTVIFNFPGEGLVDTAQYYLALSYYGQSHYVLAQVEFNRLLLNYPASAFAPQSQLMKAVCFFEGTPKHFGLDQTDLYTAIRQFEDFIIDYPESEAIGEAREYLNEAKTRLAKKFFESGMVYIRIRDYRAARIYFQNVIDNYTDTEFGALATYQMALTYYHAKDWDKAHESFENFRILFSAHESASEAAALACQASFRGGKEAFENGDLDLARTRFERYQTVCDSDDGNSEKAGEYLQRIAEAPVVEVDSADAGS